MRGLLETRDLSKHFGGLVAVDAVTLTVQPWEIYGIIGPNGAVKTTLFNVVNGYYTPKAGDVHFGGDVITGLKPHQVCQRGPRPHLPGGQLPGQDDGPRKCDDRRLQLD